MSTACDRFVELRGGLIIPAEPLLLVFDLQARGFQLTPTDGDITIRPWSRLTAENTRQLRRWKQHVLAILDYEAPII
jgi:hypothetical protein